MFQTINFGKP
uniref:Uncharacterized protein n=1 Tax=Anguilla anguilla TaxID=7936 RepID=A0A0E9Y1B5_ANGAN